MMSTLLNTHAITVHNAGGGTTGGGSSSAPRLEKLPRPTFQLDMTQSEWAFKYSQWQAYISQTPTQESIKVQQLRAACTDDLLRRVYDTGDLANMNTEELLIQQVKKIAVRVVHKTLHLQNMWSMVQAPDENVRAFVSRLLGTAELCDLFITCSKIGCSQKTSYRDEVVQQALLKGMNDSDIRTRVLSRTQNNELKDLTAVVDYIAAEEAAAASFSRLSKTIAATKSSYKQQQTPSSGDRETLLLRRCILEIAAPPAGKSTVKLMTKGVLNVTKAITSPVFADPSLRLLPSQHRLKRLYLAISLSLTGLA